ncbi:MAG: hypothetical protein H0X36_10640 [Sphingomonadaceae bacterium]|nr:hypothetical protein [Sphingomonadaceae bacterium]
MNCALPSKLCIATFAGILALTIANPVTAQMSPAMPGMDHSGQDIGSMNREMPGTDHAMTGALGPYAMNREASGTAWQPDTSEHSGIHIVSGQWMLMAHGMLNLVGDTQSGPRGDDKAFVSGMVMGMARREFANGDALQFRAMLSPDPLMGKRGYPLLLGSGETADGATQLVDRQHPHDLFMELSASYSVKLFDHASVFVYGGLPGEPAFGPPAFMHRMSIMDSPEAPITHHWLDSTPITFGVVTAGVVIGGVKLEASRFRRREPDQHRYDIEAGALDSTAVRVSWNPGDAWSLQASFARQISPEQLEPGQNQTKWSASAIHTVRIGDTGWWSTTAAWGRRRIEHREYDAFALESAIKPDARWTVFVRAELTENPELLGAHGPAYTVGKASVGAIRDFPVASYLEFGIGALASYNFVPGPLDPVYGGDRAGGMMFMRFNVN